MEEINQCDHRWIIEFDRLNLSFLKRMQNIVQWNLNFNVSEGTT
jgi:hypothetical protein